MTVCKGLSPCPSALAPAPSPSTPALAAGRSAVDPMMVDEVVRAPFAAARAAFEGVKEVVAEESGSEGVVQVKEGVLLVGFVGEAV